MYRAIGAFLTLLLFAAGLSAADLTLGWDVESTWAADTTVRIYNKTTGTAVLAGEVLGSTGQLKLTNLTPGAYRFIARAYSPVWKAESADSNEIVTPSLPLAPKNLKFTINLTITN